MRTFFSFQSAFFISLFVLLSGCATTETAKTVSAIQPPIEGLEVNKISFAHQPNEETTYRTPLGSQIVIPANSLEFEDGTEVKEPVNIQFSEFHTIADIALSGIPMVYEHQGKNHNFVSGGMFSISGETGTGRKVRVKKNKEISVGLVSHKESEFNLYLLDEESGKWSEIDNPIKTARPENVAVLPTMPAPATSEDVILDLNISKYNGSYSFESSIWKVTENIAESTKKKIRETNWTKYNVEVIDEKALLYQVILSQKGEEIKVAATPVLSPNDRHKCEKGIADEIKSMQQNLASNYYKPRVVRTVNLSGFGTVNHDVFLDSDQQLFARFEVDGVNSSDIDFFHFDLTRDMMVNVRSGNLQFNPTSQNVLIGLLPNKEVAVFAPQEYQSLEKLAKGSDVNIELTKTSRIINSAKDLHGIISDFL